METPTIRIPAFHPVPSRKRRDGWAALRQVIFIGYLAETRSVAEAARRVGMTRESAYRLRRRKGAEGFCRAWEVALTPDGNESRKGNANGNRRGEPRALSLTECVARAGKVPASRSAAKPAETAQMESHRSRALAASKITPEVAQYLTLAELRQRAEAGTYCPLMRGRRYGGYYHEDGFRAQHALAERLRMLGSGEEFESAENHAFKNAFGVTGLSRYTVLGSQGRK